MIKISKTKIKKEIDNLSQITNFNKSCDTSSKICKIFIEGKTKKHMKQSDFETKVLNFIEEQTKINNFVVSKLNEFETRLDKLEKRLDNLEVRLNNLETRMDAIENRIATLESFHKNDLSIEQFKTK